MELRGSRGFWAGDDDIAISRGLRRQLERPISGELADRGSCFPAVSAERAWFRVALAAHEPQFKNPVSRDYPRYPVKTS
jgi:hypothetical protein